jgi:hypothetical protein
MRSLLLRAMVPLALLAALPATASAARLTVGIGENEPGMFTDPLFPKLGVKNTRLVVSYNVMTRGDDELDRVRSYLSAAQAYGAKVLVTFEHARGDATICNKRKNRSKPQCKLPSAKTYERNVKAFLKAFPTVRQIVPWNEINHFTQPTSKHPKAAAKFTKIARKACRGCTVVAADLLDQADNTRAKKPKFKSATRYIKRFRKAYRGPRKICGIHNYSDINRFRTTGTQALMKALGCRQYWLTEAGGIFKFKGFKASAKRQLKATKFMFRIARKLKRVKRVYVYTYFGGVTARFDSGLVAGGKARSSFAVVRKHVKK